MAPTGTYPNVYDWGQCTWYVAGRRQVPSNWGNADTWYTNAAADGWGVGSIPRVGAIAWTSAGYYGHVALVESISSNGQSVYISEMNYDGLDIIDYRWVPTQDFSYIYQ
jgi:surface antigen